MRNVLRTAFFIDHFRWLLLGTAINGRYFDKSLLQNSKGNMLHFSDMEVYALQLKQKFIAGVFHEILQNFRTATSKDNFWELLLKRKQKRRKVRSDLCGFRCSYFPGQLFIKSWKNLLSLQVFALMSFRIWIILCIFVNLIGRQLPKVMPGTCNLPRVIFHECAKIPSVITPIYRKRYVMFPDIWNEFRGVKNTAIFWWAITWENEV